MVDFSLEEEIGVPVCGIDEVGRGPLAGPVVAACVYIPPEICTAHWMAEVKDSKKLSFKKLEWLYEEIIDSCSYGIAEVSPEEIDELNILQASLRAMSHAFIQMSSLHGMSVQSMDHRHKARDDAKNWHALIDGNKLPKLPCPATAVVKGDSKSKSIAAASILAKVTRDRIMHKLAEEFPHYGWESNVGYPSQAHKDALQIHGITPHHRKSFAPVRKILEEAA